MEHNTSHTSDEIDLSILFKKIKNIIHSVFTKINAIYYLVKNNWLLFLVSSILGIVVLYFIYSKKKPVYETSTTLISNELSHQYCEDMLSNLMQLKLDYNNTLFCKKLNISTSTCDAIVSISFEKYSKDLKAKKDSLIYNLPFKIKIQVLSPSIIDTLQNSIVAFLENNEYAIVRKQARKNMLLSINGEIDKKIIELDTLKTAILKTYGNNVSSNNSLITSRDFNPVNIYTEQINLFKEKQNNIRNLDLINNIHVIEPFNQRIKPIGLDVIGQLVTGALFGFVVCLFILLIFRKRPLS